jgi:PAS domain S-box-containing protein
MARKTNNRKKTLIGSLQIWRVVIAMAGASVLYYLPTFTGFLGYSRLGAVLDVFHNFYGLDFYSLIFFVPVVCAAYSLGVKGAVATALVSMLAFFPYAALVSHYPDAMFRSTAFVIILSAVGAVIAMLQRSDEERIRSMNELKCLYDIGKAAEESGSVDVFLGEVIKILPKYIPQTDRTKVRVVLRDKPNQDTDFKTAGGRVSAKLSAGGEELGKLEIYFTRGSPYLKKGYPLMKTLAERISGAIHSIEMEDSLNSYYEQLEDMVKERTRDLERAQEQLRLLSNTVKSSLDGITLADMGGNLTFANEASQGMWGYSPEELMGMKMSNLYSLDSVEYIEKEVIPGSRASAWNGELNAIRKDGSRFSAQVTISPVFDENKQVVAIVGVHRDITEMKEMRDRLVRSEKLAAVGELASGVGHELRNPLSVIRNAVYVLRSALPENSDEDSRKMLQILDEQVNKSNKIVTDLLNFTRVRPPSPSGVDLYNLVRESLSLVTVPQHVAVKVNVNGNSPKVVVDGEQVSHAFANIIANAVESMTGSGELAVDGGRQDGCAWITFADNGCGIPAENLKKIFEPLFTTKPKGIGLGLALTRRLIEQNKGKIEVVSKVGEGTTCTIRLPLLEKEDK